MKFEIEFEVSSDITVDIQEPDVLSFRFKLPWMIRDEETKAGFYEEVLIRKVELSPQITEEELE